MFPTIQIQTGHHRRFLAGFPWLYNNEIEQSNLTKALEAGQIVQVSYQGNPVATGYLNKHSLISFRTLSRNPAELIDADYFVKRLRHALANRENFYTTPYYRLVHAEADELPGLIIDRFGTVFVVQINTQGMENLQAPLIAALHALFEPSTIILKKDSPVRLSEGLTLKDPEMIGEPIDTLLVEENSTLFSIDISSGQKTGWFYDHRENRKLMAQLAKDKSVIDYFAYSGGFGIQAAKGGAKAVIGVDRSESAIENARRSAERSGVSKLCEFVSKEVFADMDHRIEKHQRFDIVLLDPPAFVKTKKDLNVGLKGYEKLIGKGIQLTAPQGLLMIASCSYHVKEPDLKMCLARALHKLGRPGKIVRRLSAGFDHPLHPYLEESEYLKGFVVAVD